MSSEVALRSKKAKLPRMEEQYSSMNAMEENICYSTLTSFLQKDTSFLTPWSWDPYASRNEASTSTKQNQYIRIPPGSYFSYSMFRWLKRKPRDYEYLRIASEYEKKMKIKARMKKKMNLFR
ncbi:hypothetical protein DEO72_LG7g2621 [Vigna unguiculata]|uniref:Uncharacterized protein n=1 Tax=Vigna unguiculata TaxID=3917 RepID=A0A4D6MNF9_VIGUN|nr:hypothetical protein DEO72_LG7g2621 [Vigna unguiculata]